MIARLFALAFLVGCSAGAGLELDAGDVRGELDARYLHDVAGDAMDAGGDACEVLPAIECTGVQGACPAGDQVVKEHACHEPAGQSITRALCCPLDQCVRGCPPCVGC